MLQKLIAGLMFCTVVVFTANAQKLPDVQMGGLQVPSNIKINGKPNEWGDMRAYNKATQVYYSIANDNENLYLAVKAPSVDMVEKIIKGGITLIVNAAAKKKGKDIPKITFPVYDKYGAKFSLIINNKPAPIGDAVKDKMTADSFSRAKNKQLSENLKWIGLANIKGISDSTLSIYNEEGIKVAYSINNNLAYCFEMAVPLKNLGIGTLSKFYYNIQLNGAALYSVKVMEIRPGLFGYVGADGQNYTYGSSPGATDMLFPTDFWAEYTLIKK